MREVEMKARVADRAAVFAALKSFARFDRDCDKSDVYYHLDGAPSADGKPYLSCRLRREKDPRGGEGRAFFTYKRKHVDSDGVEDNEEFESEVSSAEAVERFLLDAGFREARRKRKISSGWFAPTEAGEAHIELCSVPPLGDFLEVEIVGCDGAASAADAALAIKKIFARCALGEGDIEPRYYSQLLEEIQEKR